MPILPLEPPKTLAPARAELAQLPEPGQLPAQLPAAAPWLLRERAFLLNWLVEVLAIAAGHISHLALPLIGTTLLHATPAQMGALVAFQSLPFALFSLFIGVWVDRSSKKRLLVLSFVVLFCSLAVVPLAWALGVLVMPLLYAVGFMVGGVMALFGVAHQVLVTHTVGRERLVDAYSIISTTESVIRLAAPALAGLLIEALGAPLAVTLEVVVLVIALLLFVGVREPQASLPQPGQAGKPVWPEIREGLRYVWRDPALRTLAFVCATWQIAFHGFLALQVLFATRELHMSPGQIGVAHIFGGAGALAAGLLVKRLNAWMGPGRVMAAGVALTALAWLGFAALPSAPGWNTLAMGAALLVFDVGAVGFFINYISMRQILTPDALLGRVTATLRCLAVAPAPLGAIGAGYLAQAVGLRPTFVVLSLIGAAVTVQLLRSRAVRVASAQALG